MTYHTEKVVKEELPPDALLLTRMDVQRMLRISRTTFDALKRGGGLDEATVEFGRAFRYRREFIEKVARGEVVLPTAPSPTRQRSKDWRQQLAEAVAIRKEKAAERRAAKEAAEAAGTGSNFRKTALTEVDQEGGT